jgi:hypothetical protein
MMRVSYETYDTMEMDPTPDQVPEAVAPANTVEEGRKKRKLRPVHFVATLAVLGLVGCSIALVLKSQAEPKLEKIEGEAAELKDTVRQLQTTLDGLSARIGNSENTTGELQTTVNRLDQSVEKLSTKSAHCGYQYSWTRAGSVINYSKVEPDEGVGSLVASTGVYTAQAAGIYQVVWSLHNYLDGGKYNEIYLQRNGQKVDESRHYSHNFAGNKLIKEQGGRTMLVNLQSGDTLNLKTESGRYGFTGWAYYISFCVHLVSPQ